MIRDRYQLMDVLGTGGFGSVYRAMDHQLKREVALKVSHVVEASVLAEQRRNFEAEARVLSALHHPGICAVYDYFELRNVFYLAMELVPGQPLQDFVEELPGPVPEPELRNLMVATLEVLDHLHSQNPPIVHRDFKPANLIRTDGGPIKLVDFGISRARTRGQRDTQVVGTEGYAPPEQYVGQSEPASDIFAWAGAIFFAATGKHPLASWPPFPTLSQIRPDLPAEVSLALDRCKAHDPSQRPGARELLEWLQKGASLPVQAPASPTTSDCPFCKSSAEPRLLDCCPECFLSRGLQGLSAVEWGSRGEELLRQGVFAYAAAHLGHALKLSPGGVVWRLPLARALNRSGLAKEALGWLKQCPPEDESLMELAFARLQVPSERGLASQTVANPIGPWTRAFRLFLDKELAALQSLARDNPHLAGVSVLAIRLLCQKGHTEQALAFTEERLQESPAEPSLLRQKMQLTWEAGSIADCRLATVGLRRLAPWDPLVSLFLGRLFALERNYGRAVEELRNYLHYFPKELKTRLELAEILSTGAGRMDEAIAELEPLTSSSVGQRATEMLVHVLQMDRQHQRAVQLLTPLVRDDSEPKRMAQLALSLQQIDRRAEARSWAQKALAKDPDCELAQLLLHGRLPDAPLRPEPNVQVAAATPVTPAATRPIAPAPQPEAPKVTRILTTPAVTRPLPVTERATETRRLLPDPPVWSRALPDPAVRAVFIHLDAYGCVTEQELNQLLGSPRAVRKFSHQFIELANLVPFEVIVEVVPNGKRYLKVSVTT